MIYDINLQQSGCFYQNRVGTFLKKASFNLPNKSILVVFFTDKKY